MKQFRDYLDIHLPVLAFLAFLAWIVMACIGCGRVLQAGSAPAAPVTPGETAGQALFTQVWEIFRSLAGGVAALGGGTYLVHRAVTKAKGNGNGGNGGGKTAP